MTSSEEASDGRIEYPACYMTSYEFTAMVKDQDLGFENALLHTYGSFKQEDGSASDNLVPPAASMKHLPKCRHHVHVLYLKG